nr:hypothetical protein [Bacillus subtilis]
MKQKNEESIENKNAQAKEQVRFFYVRYGNWDEGGGANTFS